MYISTHMANGPLWPKYEDMVSMSEYSTFHSNLISFTRFLLHVESTGGQIFCMSITLSQLATGTANAFYGAGILLLTCSSVSSYLFLACTSSLVSKNLSC